MAFRPRRAATADTARQQLDWSVPQVMSVSARWARASPTRNSSFRILLPLSNSPVRSSRLTHSSTPSSRDRRSSLRIGVGPSANSTRGIEGAAVAIEPTISGPPLQWQASLPERRRHGLTEQPLHHERVHHRVIPVVVVERDEDLLGLALKRLHLRRSEEHTSELQSLAYLVCRLLLEKKKKQINQTEDGLMQDTLHRRTAHDLREMARP